MPQRRADPGGDRRRAGAAARAARARRAPSRKRSSPRTRTRSRRSRPPIAHYLLAVIEQLERDTVRLQAAYASTNQNPLGACAITGTGLPDRSRADDGAARLRRARPATPTAASRPSTICSRASAPPPCCSPGSAASCRICCSGARASSATCGWRTGSCSAAASCRRSATRSRSSTRARSAARRSARRPGIMLARPQHAVRRHRRHRGRSAAARARRCSRTRRAPCRSSRRRWRTRVRRRASWRSAPAQDWITVTELADTLARDHGLPFKAGHDDRGAADCRRAHRRRTRRWRRCCARCRSEVTGKEIVYTDGAARRDPEPAALRRSAEDARRPVAVGDARARSRVSKKAADDGCRRGCDDAREAGAAATGSCRRLRANL